MGKIYCIMGKSASGKDTVYRKVLERCPWLKEYVMYSTRPRRAGETDGITYHFVDAAFLRAKEQEGKLIESRTYETVFGPWIYATVDDGQIELSSADYLMPATLESWQSLAAYYGKDRAVPVYIEVEDGERLLRAVRREQQQETPKYRELCRRFLADCEDFSEEKLRAAGITLRFENDEAEACAERIAALIRRDRQEENDRK